MLRDPQYERNFLGHCKLLSVRSFIRLRTGSELVEGLRGVFQRCNNRSIVGRALVQYGKREEVIIATKVGLEWRGAQVFRNSTRARIMKETDDSLRCLQTDYIDIYQVHWPDPLVPIEETADAMQQLYKQGKIRAIGVSNTGRPSAWLISTPTGIRNARKPYPTHNPVTARSQDQN